MHRTHLHIGLTLTNHCISSHSLMPSPVCANGNETIVLLLLPLSGICCTALVCRLWHLMLKRALWRLVAPAEASTRLLWIICSCVHCWICCGHAWNTQLRVSDAAGRHPTRRKPYSRKLEWRMLMLS